MYFKDTPLRRASFALATLLTMAATGAMANNLSISPTKLEIGSGGNATAVTVKAQGAGRSTVQIRVFEWQEGTTPSRIKPTRDVVVSPQITQISNRQELTVRVVRINQRPLRRRTCYRVLVDKLPKPTGQRQEIALRIRHSIPLCFNP